MNNMKLEEVLKEALTYLREPLLFQNMLKNSEGLYEWTLLEWNFEKFAEKLGDVKLPFRVGYNTRFMYPQWEANCSVKYMTLQEFLQNMQCLKDNDIWYYFDYKYMQEWFKDNPEIIASLDWHKFGIDKNGSDSTLWIGSKGAHTNCHQDSYGYNIIAQIHGRKQWLLFPPSSTNLLEPTRIPYEESTIYSKLNFFCPNKEDERKILDIPNKPKLIILEPGDVLFVPWGWWHYVESLDCSMSVNVWLPLKEDNKARVREALTKLIVAGVGGQEYAISEDRDNDISYCISLVQAALQQCKHEMDSTVESPPAKKLKHTLWTVEDLVMQYPHYIKLLDDLQKHELQNFLQEKRERFPLHDDQKLPEKSFIKTLSSHQKVLASVINAICHPDVVNKTTELLLTTQSQ